MNLAFPIFTYKPVHIIYLKYLDVTTIPQENLKTQYDAYPMEVHHISTKSTSVDISYFEVKRVGDIGHPCFTPYTANHY